MTAMIWFLIAVALGICVVGAWNMGYGPKVLWKAGKSAIQDLRIWWKYR